MKRRKIIFFLFFILFIVFLGEAKSDNDESEESEEDEEEISSAEKETYKYLAKRLKQSAVETRLATKSRVVARPYAIPGGTCASAFCKTVSWFFRSL